MQQSFLITRQWCEAAWLVNPADTVVICRGATGIHRDFFGQLVAIPVELITGFLAIGKESAKLPLRQFLHQAGVKFSLISTVVPSGTSSRWALNWYSVRLPLRVSAPGLVIFIEDGGIITLRFDLTAGEHNELLTLQNYIFPVINTIFNPEHFI